METPHDNLLRTLRRQGFDQVRLDCGGFCPSQVEAFKARFGHDDIPGYFNSPFRSIWLWQEKTWMREGYFLSTALMTSCRDMGSMGVFMRAPVWVGLKDPVDSRRKSRADSA